MSIDTASTEYLLSALKVSPAAVADVFGRPDYWSPGHFVDCGATEFWCQRPRWDIHNREQPISVYMRYDTEGDSTTYLVSGGKDDYIINQLQEFLRSQIKEASRTPSFVLFIDPFEIHYLIAGFNMALGIASKLKHAHEEFFSSMAEKSPTSARILGSQRLTYSIRWLNSSFESQLRWLHSYKARKDTSMTFGIQPRHSAR